MKTSQIGPFLYQCPFADLLPPLTTIERDALGQSIKESGGVKTPIVVYPVSGAVLRVIDGANRVALVHELGLTTIPFSVLPEATTEEEQRRLAIELNIHRRHLTPAQRLEVMIRLAQEGKSLRAIAAETGVSHTHVAAALKGSGVKPLTPQVTGRDGKSYPATQPKREAPSAGAGTFPGQDPRLPPAQAQVPQHQREDAPPTPEGKREAGAVGKGLSEEAKRSLEETVDAHFKGVEGRGLDPLTMRARVACGHCVNGAEVCPACSGEDDFCELCDGAGDVACSYCTPAPPPRVSPSGEEEEDLGFDRDCSPAPSTPPAWSNDDWNTPPEVLELVRRVNLITLDPCSNQWSQVGAEVAITQEQGSGLDCDWWQSAGKGLVYVNPPYSDPGVWVAKMAGEAQRGTEILALVPAAVGTVWWHDHALQADAIVFPKGRLHFWREGTRGGGARFDAAYLYWGPNVPRFCEAFQGEGWLVFPARRAA
jgi:phage N-6-adenine-methyltransferase